jgi:hypothetical protein
VEVAPALGIVQHQTQAVVVRAAQVLQELEPLADMHCNAISQILAVLTLAIQEVKEA